MCLFTEQKKESAPNFGAWMGLFWDVQSTKRVSFDANFRNVFPINKKSSGKRFGKKTEQPTRSINENEENKEDDWTDNESEEAYWDEKIRKLENEMIDDCISYSDPIV